MEFSGGGGRSHSIRPRSKDSRRFVDRPVDHSAGSTAVLALYEEANVSIPTDRTQIGSGRFASDAEAVRAKKVFQLGRLAGTVLLLAPKLDFGKPIVQCLASRARDLAPRLS